jgi:hypothetical protein
MSTKPLSLDEVSKLVEELSPEDVVNHVGIMDFIGRVEEMGKEILGQKEECGKYIESASDFLCAAVVSGCLGGDDVEDTLVALQMLKNPRMFKLILGYSFIYAVGLCATEELR